jgi:hypothetical protein
MMNPHLWNPKLSKSLLFLPHLSQSYIIASYETTHSEETSSVFPKGYLMGVWDLNGKMSRKTDRQRKGAARRGRQEEGGKKRAELIVEEPKDTFGGGVAQRRNVFDDEELDVTRIRVGKQELG